MNTEVISIILLTIVLSAVFIGVGRKLKKLDPMVVPKGITRNLIFYVETLTNYTVESMGEEHGKPIAGYIGSVFTFILLANMMGLLGLDTPTSSLSVTLVFALISFILVQRASIKKNGVKGYVKGYFEPIIPFVIPNFFGTVAPLISLSLRLFGNVLSGGVIMTLVYTFAAWISSFLFGTGFNWFGVVIAPVLHLYFDLFSAFLQAFIFISLTQILISVEYQD